MCPTFSYQENEVGKPPVVNRNKNWDRIIILYKCILIYNWAEHLKNIWIYKGGQTEWFTRVAVRNCKHVISIYWKCIDIKLDDRSTLNYVSSKITWLSSESYKVSSPRTDWWLVISPSLASLVSILIISQTFRVNIKDRSSSLFTSKYQKYILSLSLI